MKKIVTLTFLLLFFLSAHTVSAAWSTDSKNYFNEWQCTSTIGINHIAKLDILPKSLNPNIHKDSLYADFRDMVGNNPTLHFSISEPNTAWYMDKAIYNTGTNTWIVSEEAKNTSPGYGVSNFDGSNSDYIMGEYLIPGWGPTANKPGSQSKIPGVSESHVTNYHGGISVGYPLVGTGPLGLTTIQNVIRDPNYSDPNAKTCLHMNATLFNFDASGVPHSLTAYLFTQDVNTGCTLPDGTTLQPGDYVYRFVNNSIGWQLDLPAGLLDKTQAINYAWGSTSKFITNNWTGKIQIADLNQPLPRSPQTTLDCSAGNVYITEASGKENIFYFLSGQLNPVVVTHDVYVAFADTGQQANSADLNGDGKVDIFDYNLLVGNFGKTGTNLVGDIDKNGKVDIFDYNQLVENFGK